MKTLCLALFVFAALVANAFAAFDSSVVWTKHLKDPANTNFFPSSRGLIATGTTRDSIILPGYSSAAVVSDSNANYYVTLERKLYAYSFDGTLRYTVVQENSTSLSHSTPLVDLSDNSVYFQIGDFLYGYTADGRKKWNAYIGSTSWSLSGSGLVFALNGDLLSLDGAGFLRAFDKATGTLKATFDPQTPTDQETSTPAVHPTTGEIFFATNKAIFALHPDYTLKWRAIVPKQADSSITLDVARNVLYYHEDTGTLYALSLADGAVVWTFDIKAKYNTLEFSYCNSIALDTVWSNVIYYPLSASVLVLNSETGAIMYNITVPNTQQHFCDSLSTPVLTSDHVMYFSTMCNPVTLYAYKVTETGATFLWSYVADDTNAGGSDGWCGKPSLSVDGSIFLINNRILNIDQGYNATVFRVGCPAGTRLDTDGTCQACPPGTASHARLAICQQCPAGTVSTAPGQSACTACPVNFTPNADHTACIAADHNAGSSDSGSNLPSHADSSSDSAPNHPSHGHSSSGPANADSSSDAGQQPVDSSSGSSNNNNNESSGHNNQHQDKSSASTSVQFNTGLTIVLGIATMLFALLY